MKGNMGRERGSFLKKSFPLPSQIPIPPPSEELWTLIESILFGLPRKNVVYALPFGKGQSNAGLSTIPKDFPNALV